MNCHESQNLLHAYLDGELDLVRTIELEKHIETCPQCQQFCDAQAALKEKISACAPYFTAPEELRQKIAAATRDAIQSETPGTVRHWQWNGPTVGLCIAAALAFGFFLAIQFFNPHAASEALVDELASSHIRSLLATHLVDVTSSDQHTVKPWFDGKLDFAPPVRDLANRGFPLIGGRLDYIGGRNVAVLVYQSRKHLINLFIWPATDGLTTKPGTARRGYNLVSWSDSGMTFCAVSDLNQKELLGFEEAVKQPDSVVR